MRLNRSQVKRDIRKTGQLTVTITIVFLVLVLSVEILGITNYTPQWIVNLVLIISFGYILTGLGVMTKNFIQERYIFEEQYTNISFGDRKFV